jgi:hypothetical protein
LHGRPYATPRSRNAACCQCPCHSTKRLDATDARRNLSIPQQARPGTEAALVSLGGGFYLFAYLSVPAGMLLNGTLLGHAPAGHFWLVAQLDQHGIYLLTCDQSCSSGGSSNSSSAVPRVRLAFRPVDSDVALARDRDAGLPHGRNDHRVKESLRCRSLCLCQASCGPSAPAPQAKCTKTAALDP